MSTYAHKKEQEALENIRSTFAVNTTTDLSHATAQHIINDLMKTRRALISLRDHKNITIINEHINQFLQSLAFKCSHTCKKLPKRIILIDSGANTTVLNQESSSHTPITTRSKPCQITVANGTKVLIDQEGTFLGKQADFSPAFRTSVLSISQHTQDNSHIAIFLHDKMYLIKYSHLLKPLLDKIQDISQEQDLITLTAENRNGLYEADLDNLKKHLVTTLEKSKNVTTYHVPNYYENRDATLYSNTTYYTDIPNVHADKLSDIVRFFHEAWGHPDKVTMCNIVKNNTYINIPKALTEKAINKYFPINCKSCPFGNLTSRANHPNLEESISRLDHPIEKGQECELDLQGTWTDKNGKPVQTFNGCQYSLLAMCCKTGFAFGQLLRTRGYLLRSIKHIHEAITRTGRVLKTLRCDSEFVTDEIKEYCSVHHITISACIPHEHDTLPRVERLHRTIREMVLKSLAFRTHLSDKYWGMAFHDAVLKYNATPTHRDPTTTPYTEWTGKKHDLLNNPLLAFGTIVMAHLPIEQQHALSGRSFEAYYVGCAPDYRGGILLYNPVSKRTIIRRSYKVLGDNAQPAMNLKYESEQPSGPEEYTDDPFGNDTAYDYDPSDLPPLNHEAQVPAFIPNEEYVVEKILGHKGHYTRPASMKFLIKWLGYDHSYNSWINWHQANELAAMDTYEQNNPDIEFPPTKTVNAFSVNNTGQPDLKITPSLKQYPRIDKTSTKIPNSVEQATSSYLSQYWLEAQDLEITSHIANDAWETPTIPITNIPKNKIISSKFKYDIVYNPDDSLKKFKARLLLRGDMWHDEAKNNFAATVDMDIIKLLLAIAAEEDLEMESIDVKSAFQTAPLKPEEEVYIRRPKGLTDKHMPPIVRLKKALNGLPQASARFRDHMDKILRSFGCVPTSQHPCVYILKHEGVTAYIPVFVDDIGLLAKDKTIFQYIKEQLSKHFTITINDDMNYYLGMHIVRDRKNRSMDLFQTRYLNDMLQKFKIDPTATSFPSTPLLWDTSDDKNQKPSPLLDAEGIRNYQSRVGSLLHLANITRNDLLFGVQLASRNNKSPTEANLAMVNRMLNYVAGTRTLGVRLHSGEGIQLYATVDSSYGTHKDCKSHTGCTLSIGKSSGSFKSCSKKQPITADSSTVAEFIGCHIVLKHILSARIFLEELGYPQKQPTILFQDNLSTIAMINNPAHSKRTRHLEIRFNMIREHIQNGNITMQYLSTDKMTSDILTKALAKHQFEAIRPLILGM